MRRTVALAAILLLIPSCTASVLEGFLQPADDVLEPATGVSATYQEDGGVHGDAPDTCQQAAPDRVVDLDGVDTAGMLVDIDDESDAYFFELTEQDVGNRVGLDMLAGLLNDRYDITFDVFAPGCDASVFDYGSSYYDPAPADPYSPPPGSIGAEAGGLSGYDCGSEWKFLANQMGGIPAPETIYVEWTDGTYEYVPVDKSTPATIAMYLTSSHPEVTVERAVIVVPASYKGEFNLVHGFCGAVEGEPPLPPLREQKAGEFTVQEAGPHVVVVYIERGTVDKTVDTVEELVGVALDPPSTFTANCHSDICTLALGDASYNLGAQTLSL